MLHGTWLMVHATGLLLHVTWLMLLTPRKRPGFCCTQAWYPPPWVGRMRCTPSYTHRLFPVNPFPKGVLMMEDNSDCRAPPRAYRKKLKHCLRLTVIAAIAVSSVGYLLPTAVALYRHRMSRFDRWLLFLLNVGAGWTIIGWWVTLRIAQLTDDEPRGPARVAPRLPRQRTSESSHLPAGFMATERRHVAAAKRRVNAGCGWIRYRPVSADLKHCAATLAARRSWRIGVREPPTPPGLSRIERFAMLGLDSTDQRWPRRGLRA